MSDDRSTEQTALRMVLASVAPAGVEILAGDCDKDPDLVARIQAAVEARPSMLGDIWARIQAARARRAMDAIDPSVTPGNP